MQNKSRQIDFSGQKIYIGIDVHKKQFTVSICGESLFYKTFSQVPEREILVNYLHRNFPGAASYAAYEAGFCGFWIQEHLKNRGVDCIVVNANDIPTTDREKKQKRDPLDSRKIARCLRNGDLTGIYIPDKQSLLDRSLVRVRQRIITNQTRGRNRIKGLLYFYGVEYPVQFHQSGTHWSKRFMSWLEQLDLGNESGNKALNLFITEAIHLRDLQLRASKDIRDLSKADRYRENVKMLLTVPEIGLLTARMILVELGDIRGFRSLDQLCSYVGLIPNVYASGDKERIGDITKRGNKFLKGYSIESSWVAVRNDPALGSKYHQLCQRMNGNKAIIRITRKLLNRIKFVLTTNEEYVLSVA